MRASLSSIGETSGILSPWCHGELWQLSFHWFWLQKRTKNHRLNCLDSKWNLSSSVAQFPWPWWFVSHDHDLFCAKDKQFCRLLRGPSEVTPSTSSFQRRWSEGVVIDHNWSRFMATPIFEKLENKYSGILRCIQSTVENSCLFCCQGPWWKAMRGNEQRCLNVALQAALLYRPKMERYVKIC